MRLLYRFAAFVLACAASFAQATPQHKVATGLWIDPNESGWGLNLFHQGDTVWASLFVYGPDGQPKWYTASDMTSSDDGPSHDRPTTVSGDLFEATGPYFGGAFNPAVVQRRKVGAMVIDLGNNISGVSYTVDGVSVTKQVVPFTFGVDRVGGSFVGYIYDPVTGAQENVGFGMGTGSTFGMRTFGPTSGHCEYSGSTTNSRNYIRGGGTYTCDKGASGAWSMNVDATPDGFVGSFNGPGITSPSGRVAAATDGIGPYFGDNGWRSDLWFPANEPGWGVNILEQADTIFATLFVYDAQGRPRWYSASNLKRIGSSFDQQVSYIGSLQESTGPYFGTSFNPAAVTRRDVGTMSFKVQADGSAVLTYGVDGVGVSKVVQRYAFRKNAMAGTYLGHRVVQTMTDPVTITITDDGTFTMDMSDSGNDGSCRYTAPMAQIGEQRRMEGQYACSKGRAGHWVLYNVIVTFDGFTASFDGNDWTRGHVEGVRRERN